LEKSAKTLTMSVEDDEADNDTEEDFEDDGWEEETDDDDF
jgi:hypothetical protein